MVLIRAGPPLRLVLVLQLDLLKQKKQKTKKRTAVENGTGQLTVAKSLWPIHQVNFLAKKTSSFLWDLLQDSSANIKS